MPGNSHAEREIKVFQAFADSCNLPIKIETIRKMDPPTPDIQCEIENIGMVSFELVEITEQDFEYSTHNELKKYKY